jgi:hypothetical protein
MIEACSDLHQRSTAGVDSWCIPMTGTDFHFQAQAAASLDYLYYFHRVSLTEGVSLSNQR